MVDTRVRRAVAFGGIAGVAVGFALSSLVGPNAAQIDADIQAALINVLGIALVGALGVFATLTASRIGADAQAAATALAREEGQLTRDDARTARLTTHKVELAANLLIAADRHWRQARAHAGGKEEKLFSPDKVITVPGIDPSEPAREALQAMILVSPAVATAAQAVYDAAVRLGELAAAYDPYEPGRGQADEWDRLTAAWPQTRDAYVDAVQLDLGLAPLS